MTVAPELVEGDVVAILSNGGFGGIYEKLPAKLKQLPQASGGSVKRHSNSMLCCLLAFLFLSVAIPAQAATRVTCDTPVNPQHEPTEYFVSLADAPTHTAHVSIRLAEFSGSARLAMPVWNALYQVRNFAAHVEDVRAQDGSGRPLSILQSSTSEWDINGAPGCALVSYDVYLDTPGPFGSELDAEHGFFNWAMVLMYSPELRSKEVSIRLLDVPANWALRDTHVFGGEDAGKVEQSIGVAENYDTLVDSPAETGVLQQYTFEQDNAIYHIVVHGDPGDYDAVGLQSVLKRITHATVDWMADHPYHEYTFLYDFPRGPGSGGMEHAYGTAISASAYGVVDLDALASLSAHEFFHLWNVKRIRPQSLDPIDYQHQQDTRALWFSEGATNTVSELMLARAGLIDEQQYLKHLATAITELEGRPAHLWQSAEDSSLNAWLEGNAFYRTPQRSISYYNKGEILGVLLDLRIRALTQGNKSLRDLFQWMNEHYAKQHRYFPDSAGVREAAESITGQSFADFFRDYVAGVNADPLRRVPSLRWTSAHIRERHRSRPRIYIDVQPGRPIRGHRGFTRQQCRPCGPKPRRPHPRSKRPTGYVSSGSRTRRHDAQPNRQAANLQGGQGAYAENEARRPSGARVCAR